MIEKSRVEFIESPFLKGTGGCDPVEGLPESIVSIKSCLIGFSIKNTNKHTDKLN